MYIYVCTAVGEQQSYIRERSINMEVKSSNSTLQLNRAATAVDNSSSGGNSRQQFMELGNSNSGKQDEKKEETVRLSISAAGLRQSLLRERQAEKENNAKQRETQEIDEMLKKMEGLSSQVINGHFSTTDRINFNNEINRLTDEINKLNGEGISFRSYDSEKVNQKINDLTRIINDAAVYRRSASAVFVVNNRQLSEVTKKTKLDITI